MSSSSVRLEFPMQAPTVITKDDAARGPTNAAVCQCGHHLEQGGPQIHIRWSLDGSSPPISLPPPLELSQPQPRWQGSDSRSSGNVTL